MFKWLDRKFTEAEESRLEQEKDEDENSRRGFLKAACKMAKENEIEDAIHTVWTKNSAIIVTEDFLYYHGSSSKGNWTTFHRGEALALNKIVSIEADYDTEWGGIDLRFVDGGRRFVKSFGNTKELCGFFKSKAIL